MPRDTAELAAEYPTTPTARALTEVLLAHLSARVLLDEMGSGTPYPWDLIVNEISFRRKLLGYSPLDPDRAPAVFLSVMDLRSGIGPSEDAPQSAPVTWHLWVQALTDRIVQLRTVDEELLPNPAGNVHTSARCRELYAIRQRVRLLAPTVTGHEPLHPEWVEAAYAADLAEVDTWVEAAEAYRRYPDQPEEDLRAWDEAILGARDHLAVQLSHQLRRGQGLSAAERAQALSLVPGWLYEHAGAPDIGALRHHPLSGLFA